MENNNEKYPVAVGEKITFRARMTFHDAHYAGELVNGSKMLDYFGDVATDLTIRLHGHEGLYRTYEHIDFLAPILAGDFIDYVGWITRVGNTSIQFHLEAYKVMQNLYRKEPGVDPAFVEILDPPILVGMADSIGVVPKEFQRGAQDPRFEIKK